jgi:hypothetical protein
MEQVNRTWDIAFWRLASSPWPDIVACVVVDEWALPFEVVQALMQERKETYVYKALVGMASEVQRYWHVKLPHQREKQVERVSVNEVGTQLWLLIEADGVDPVEVHSHEALDVVRAEASCDPVGLFARWCQGMMAVDERAFADRWNDRRSAEVRRRLQVEMEMSGVETRR